MLKKLKIKVENSKTFEQGFEEFIDSSINLNHSFINISIKVYWAF